VTFEGKWAGSWLSFPEPQRWLATFEEHSRVTVGFSVVGQSVPQALSFGLRGLAAALHPYRSACVLPTAAKAPTP
jgi:hypothetical protein